MGIAACLDGIRHIVLDRIDAHQFGVLRPWSKVLGKDMFLGVSPIQRKRVET